MKNRKLHTFESKHPEWYNVGEIITFSFRRFVEWKIVGIKGSLISLQAVA